MTYQERNPEDHSFAADIERAIAAAGPGVTPAAKDSPFDYVVGKSALGTPSTADRLDEIATSNDKSFLGFAVADAPDHGLGWSRAENGDAKWQIIDAHTGEKADQADHANASSALASMRELAGIGLTYEGIDARENEASWLMGMDLPGNKVRFDSDIKIRGIDPHDTIATLGTEPLTISKSVVIGKIVPDGMGGERDVVHLEYEFEGKEGRHSAQQFMEEGGREHMYATILVRDDRMWAVPMVEDHIKQDGTMLPDGPAREITGFTGNNLNQLHPDGFEGMKEDVRANDGISGEFYVQPRDGFGTPGPVNLLASPLQSDVSGNETALAETAIAKAIAQEERARVDPVGVLIDDMSQHSAVWRSEKPVPTNPVDVEAAIASSKDEMRYLTRGRDMNDADIRMAAAIVATEGRDVTAGSLSSKALADGMAPSTGRGASLLSAAAALHSAGSARKTPSKGPIASPATPPYGAAMMRDGNVR